MKLNNLRPAEGSTHSRRRIGRGPGSGLGGTSTRGHKGAKSRSGYKRKIGFEGGQMPLQRRIPKAGFKNINHREFFAVNLSTLQKLAEEKGLTKIGVGEMVAANVKVRPPFVTFVTRLIATKRSFNSASLFTFTLFIAIID